MWVSVLGKALQDPAQFHNEIPHLLSIPKGNKKGYTFFFSPFALRKIKKKTKNLSYCVTKDKIWKRQ